MLGGRKALALGAAFLISLGAHSAWSASVDDSIKQRKADMKQIGGQMKVIKDYLGGNGTNADVVAGANKINALTKTTPALFKERSALGDAGISVETESLPKIWEDPAGFEKAWAVLAAESKKLAEVAANDDPDAIAAQFGAMGKNGCGGCHKAYRKKK